MSPILKRDIAEHVRQARRLAAAAGVVADAADDGYPLDALRGAPEPERSAPAIPPALDPAIRDTWDTRDTREMEGRYASGVAGSAGAGAAGAGAAWGRTRADDAVGAAGAVGSKGKGRAGAPVPGEAQAGGDADDDGRIGGLGRLGQLDRLGARAYTPDTDDWDAHGMAGAGGAGGAGAAGEAGAALLPRPGKAGGLGVGAVDDDDGGGAAAAGKGAWADLRGLLLESTPSLLLSLVGLVFTGELLEHLARWRVFRRVDELFILVPMIGNLKGNLEMCLSARLGTSAAIGELDDRRTRRLLLTANMTLLGLQALLIASLAAAISFVLGLLTTHRLGDPASAAAANGTLVDPGLAVGEQEWHEGYTRPGWKQLVMVLATGMGAAGLSSLVLGSFMSSVIVLCRWTRIDPDNVTPPIAACLGDLVTLFILALLGTALVGAMDTPVPLLAVAVLAVAAGWFTRRVMRDEWVRNVARGGWLPLIGAMLISSGTGMVLAKGVAKYRGFALLAISMTGLTGALGAVHANRLSTSLHAGLHAPAGDGERRARGPAAARAAGPTPARLGPARGAAALFVLAFPCQAAFLACVRWAGWIDFSLGWPGWAAYAATAAFSLVSAHYMTLVFWSLGLDPDSYTLPIHSAIVDFVGQLVLMLAYEACLWAGRAEVAEVVAA